MENDSSPGIFRGWVVLAGLFVTMTVTSGLGFYAQGVFLDALVVEQGFSVGVAGAGTGVFFTTSGIAGYYAGRLLATFDARLVMSVGSLIGATGLALLGQVRNEFQMVVVMIIFGMGFALTSLVPSSAIVTRWFVRKRSVALSIASSGLSLGGIALSPVVATVVDADSMIYWAPRLAIAFLIGMLPAVLILIRGAPEPMGLRPDGDPPLKSGERPKPPEGIDYKTAVRSRYFVLISVTFIICMAAQVGAKANATDAVIALGALKMMHNIAANTAEKGLNMVLPQYGYQLEGFTESLKDPAVDQAVDQCLAEIAADSDIMKHIESPYVRLAIAWGGALVTSIRKAPQVIKKPKYTYAAPVEPRPTREKNTNQHCFSGRPPDRQVHSVQPPCGDDEDEV